MSALATVAAKTGAVVLPDSNGWTNRLQIRSGTSDKLYIVAQRQKDGKQHGDFACSCLAWIMSQKRGTYTCKHLNVMGPILTAAFAKPSETPTKKIGR